MEEKKLKKKKNLECEIMRKKTRSNKKPKAHKTLLASCQKERFCGVGWSERQSGVYIYSLGGSPVQMVY